jgi:acyl dehydratase
MSINSAKYKIKDLSVGQTFSFQKTIKETDVNKFADLSRDTNPLHMEDQFAIQKGFAGRVVHGVLLSSYLSKLVGVDFPGENALLHSVELNFLSPAYINDKITICAVIDQISVSTNTIILKVNIKNMNNTLILKGKMQVGFTKTKIKTTQRLKKKNQNCN